LIEEALLRHPDVQLAAAIGEPDAYAGEVPVAFVVLKAGASATADDLLAFVAPHIAERPALPKRIELLPALPLTAIGKVYKPALRARAIERVLRERLARAASTHGVQLAVLDEAKGLSACFTVSAADAANARAAITHLMAPFAIDYRIEP
jgi:fatty-acyl-CoA synthase